MTSPNPSGVTVTPPGYYDPHNFVATPAPYDPAIPWIPSDNGLLVASADLSVIGNPVAVAVNGNVNLTRVNIRQSLVLNNIWFQTSAAGVGGSTGSFVGIYSSAGVLLGQSADTGALLIATAGPQQAPLTAPVPVAPGMYWLAFLCNLATTPPTLRAPTSNVNIQNTNLAAAFLAAAVNGTGRTTLAGNITPASNTPTGAISAWMGAN